MLTSPLTQNDACRRTVTPHNALWFLWDCVLRKPNSRARPTGNASDSAGDEEEAVAAADEDGELTCAATCAAREGDITEQVLEQLLPSSLKEQLARIDFDLTHSAPSQLNVDSGSVSGPNVCE